MGVYDYIKCEKELPGNPAAWVYDGLQTQDTDERWLETFTITKDGRLFHNGADTNFHGDIQFCNGNIAASYKGLSVVREGTGDKVQFWDFLARFTDGQLQSIALVAHVEREAVTWEAFNSFKALSA